MRVHFFSRVRVFSFLCYRVAVSIVLNLFLNCKLELGLTIELELELVFCCLASKNMPHVRVTCSVPRVCAVFQESEKIRIGDQVVKIQGEEVKGIDFDEVCVVEKSQLGAIYIVGIHRKLDCSSLVFFLFFPAV